MRTWLIPLKISEILRPASSGPVLKSDGRRLAFGKISVLGTLALLYLII